MKNFLFLILFIPFISFAGGKVIGNGGDEVALDFYHSALNAIAQVDDSVFYPEVSGVDLMKVLTSTEILVSEFPVFSEKDDVRQFSIAINHKDPNTVIIHRQRWNNISNKIIKEAVALHEILSLVGIESTGNYKLSKRYLERAGIYCQKDLCDELPRYSCALDKFDIHGDALMSVKGDLGDKGTKKENLDLQNENIKATISMDNTAAEGGIIIALFQNDQKVAVNWMKGTMMPPFIYLEWKDPMSAFSWSSYCKMK